MKSKLITLGLLSLVTTVLLSANSILSLGEYTSTSKEDAPKPVDDAVKNIHKEDKVKGSTTVPLVFESKTLSLSKENGETYQIIIKKVSHAPLTCKITREGKEIESISRKKRNFLVFDINTSQLKVDDNITLSNNHGEAMIEIMVEE